MSKERKSKEPPTIEVHFLHPRNANSLTADVSLLCTGAEALEGLLATDEGEPFLEPLSPGRSYDLSLRRTGQQILLNMTFGEAGLVHGDTVDVGLSATGAGPGFDFQEIAGLLLTSGVTLAALKSFTQIIVALIENRGKKSVTLKLGNGEEVTLTGSNSVNDLIKAVLLLEQHKGTSYLADDVAIPSGKPEDHGQSGV